MIAVLSEIEALDLIGLRPDTEDKYEDDQRMETT
jgi:hypothetical protein